MDTEIILAAVSGTTTELAVLLAGYPEGAGEALASSCGAGKRDKIIFMLNNYDVQAERAFLYSYLCHRFEDAEYILDNYKMNHSHLLDWIVANNFSKVNPNLVEKIKLTLKIEQDYNTLSKIPEIFPPKSVHKC